MTGDSITTYFRAVLRSYSMLFFSQHLGLAGLLLLVTFAHPAAGVAGLGSVLLAVGAARLGGFNRAWTDAGAYGFNALLTGLALATYFPPGWALAGLVAVGAGVALLLSVALGGWLSGRGLPFLSLPFVGTTWLLLLGGGQLLHLVPGETGVYWLNEVYALGGPRLVAAAQWVGDWPWPPLLATYLRALGSVVFQDSAAAGLLVALGLLWHSRIAFSLSVLGFLGAYGVLLLAGLTGYEAAASGLSEYNLGANYIVAAIAVGSVFVIPSAASYGWALLSVPVTVLALAGLTAALDKAGLPALSLPFCATALLLLYVLLLRERPGRGLVLTPVQRYSPEHNLYAHATDRLRLAHQDAVALTLPFLGSWRCTQGYHHGGPTHLGDWGHALDFVIADADGRTWQGTGLSLSDYYAYNKPVLAPADGVVVEVIQHLDDNAIGEVNLSQNWGNTVVIRHAPGLYTQLSHLRAHSVPVKPGDYVRRGDIVGTCGSSGRSPEPHLHFQVQATPYVGSRTMPYPLAWFVATPETATAAVVPSHELAKTSRALQTSLPALDKTLLALENPFLGPKKSSLPLENSFPPLENPFPPRENYFPPLENPFPPRENYFPPLENSFSKPEKPFPGLVKASGVSVASAGASAKASTPAGLPGAASTLSPQASMAAFDASALASTTAPTAFPPSPTPQLRHYAVPVAGDTVCPPAFNRTLSQALRLPPGYVLDVRDARAPEAPAQRWEVFTDAYNLSYLRCQRTGAVLYFGGDESVLYCTAWYGDESSWLYLLYQAAYRVPLALLPGQLTHDELPLSVVRRPLLRWVQDFVAPFFRFVRPTFALAAVPPSTAEEWAGRAVRLRSRVAVAWFGRAHEACTAELVFREEALAELRVQQGGQAFHLTCSPVRA